MHHSLPQHLQEKTSETPLQSQQASNIIEDGPDVHLASFRYRTKPIPVRITFVDRNSNIASQSHVNFNNLLTFPYNNATQSSNLPTSGDSAVDDAARIRPKEFGLKLLLSNTMSLALKIDEIRCCVLDWKPDVACFTETWLHDSINDNHIYIPEYNYQEVLPLHQE